MELDAALNARIANATALRLSTWWSSEVTVNDNEPLNELREMAPCCSLEHGNQHRPYYYKMFIMLYTVSDCKFMACISFCSFNKEFMI